MVYKFRTPEAKSDMRIHISSRLFVAVVSLVLAALACNRSTATVTPVAPLPTLPPPTPSPSPTALPPAHTPTRPSLPTDLPPIDTPMPSPSPTPTPVIPLACPPPGDPVPPDRPVAFDDYAGALAAYLSAGGSPQELERLLREWGAITDDVGEVRSLDMTGDMDPEIVVALVDPAPEFDLPWPPGDVLIFQCQRGAVVPAYQGRGAIGQDLSDLRFSLYEVEDVNGTGRADAVYVTSSCGAHTCWDRLYIMEWDGVGFVNRVPDMGDYPYATFTVEEGQIQVHAGGVGSAGAGYQRSHSEVWAWDGKLFTVTEKIIGPPVTLIHYIHDGDDALARGDYGAAIGHYQGALENTTLPAGLFLESEEEGAVIVRSYARFKLLVAYAAAGDGRGAQAQYDLLLTEHPEGIAGHPYVPLGQAFWADFLANEAPRSACAAVVALAESDPTLAERLYAGYANPEYEPADLCRVGE
jgi:hypothetical protein